MLGSNSMVSKVKSPSELAWDNSPDFVRNHVKTQIIALIFGSIPLNIGRKIRSLAYQSVVGKMGKNVSLGTGLELWGANRSFFEDNVYIFKDVRFNCSTPGSRINIGTGVTIEQGVVMSALGGHIEVKSGASIGCYTCMAGPGSISIGKQCMIASHCGIYANNHTFSDPNLPIIQQDISYRGICIEDDCWLGCGVKVLDGATIGRGSVIGAGAVVTKDIPPFSVAVGVPAKVISKRG